MCIHSDNVFITPKLQLGTMSHLPMLPCVMFSQERLCLPGLPLILMTAQRRHITSLMMDVVHALWAAVTQQRVLKSKHQQILPSVPSVFKVWFVDSLEFQAIQLW